MISGVTKTRNWLAVDARNLGATDDFIHTPAACADRRVSNYGDWHAVNPHEWPASYNRAANVRLWARINLRADVCFTNNSGRFSHNIAPTLVSFEDQSLSLQVWPAINVVLVQDILLDQVKTCAFLDRGVEDNTAKIPIIALAHIWLL